MAPVRSNQADSFFICAAHPSPAGASSPATTGAGDKEGGGDGNGEGGGDGDGDGDTGLVDEAGPPPRVLAAPPVSVPSTSSSARRKDCSRLTTANKTVEGA